jgi:hypothetical protein
MSEDPYDLYAGSASDSSLRGGRRLSEHRRRDDDVRDVASAEGRKLFIGGLSWDTTDEGFRRFFEREALGDVLKIGGRSVTLKASVLKIDA